VAQPKFDIGGWFPEDMKLESLNFKAPEDPDDKAARLLREKWSFFFKELGVYFLSYLFLFAIGGYCCFVVIRYGAVSQEARAVFPLLTTLFGGVLGVIVGKNAK
jgi:hypothetical protein